MSNAPVHLRKIYKTCKQYNSFYTGGPIKIGGQNQNLCFCTYGDVINVLELQTGVVLHTIKGDEQTITSVDVHSETNDVIFSTFSKLIYHLTRNEFYEQQIADPAYHEKTEEEKSLITPWKVQRKWKSHERPILDISFDSTGTFCATASADRTAKVWNLQQGFCTHNFKGHTGVVSLVRFHPDPNKLQLFTASDDCTVRIWDLITKSAKVLDGHMSQVTSFAFLRSGWELVTSGRDRVLTTWDLRTGNAIKTIPVFESVEAIGLLDNSKSELLSKYGDYSFVVSAGDKGVLKVWNVKTGDCIYTHDDHFNSQYLQLVQFKGQDNRFITANTDQNILIYNINDDSFDREKIICGNNDEIIDISYTNGGSHIAVATNSDKVKLYNMETSDCRMLLGHEDTVVSVDANKDGSLIATSSKDNSVRVWDTTTLRCIAVCQGHTESVGTVCFSKRSNDFVVSGSQDKTIKVWDIKQATKYLQSSSSSTTKKLQSSNDQTTLTCKSLSTIKAHDKEINSISVSPNDSLLATGSQDSTIRIWDKQNMNLIATMKGHKRGVWCVEFSNIDKCLASASGDHTVKLWSLVDYTCLKTFEGHGNSVLKVRFITAGLQLLSCGSDAVIKLWNIKSNECINTFDNHDDRIWSLAVRNDGEEFVSGGSDSTINIWKDYTEIEEEEAAKAQEGKILQEQELSNLLREKQYKRAMMIAFDLDQPNRIYNLFDELIDSNALNEVDSILSDIPRHHLIKCFSYIRDWNTTAKQSQLAQYVLNRILVIYPPAELSKLPAIKDILVALMAYSDRHFQRFDSLLQKSYIIDYSLQQMKVAPQLLDSNHHQSEYEEKKDHYLQSKNTQIKNDVGAQQEGEQSEDEDQIIITADDDATLENQLMENDSDDDAREETVESAVVRKKKPSQEKENEKKSKSPKAMLLKKKLTQKRKSLHNSPQSGTHKKVRVN